MRLTRSDGQEIIIEDSPFAKGGEGSIYFIKTNVYKDHCVKLFHQGKLSSRKTKLDYMIAHQLMAPTNSQYRICWPLDYVFDGSTCVGFIMPLAFPNSWSLYEIYLDDSNDVFNRSSKSGVENRYKLLYNIAQAINILHQSGYVLVDFKLQNILCSSRGQISMIDLDSIQICEKSKLLFPATAYTIEYSYPKELHKIGKPLIISNLWDCYSYSIVAYQTLLGIHPFTASTNVRNNSGESISGLSELMYNGLFPFGRRKSDIYAYPPIQNYYYLLPKDIQKLFVKSFDIQTSPPNMTEWLSALYRVVQNKEAKENLFRSKPKPPIIIFEDPKLSADNKNYIVNLICSFCDRLEYEGQNVPTNKPLIISKDIYEISLSASNSFVKNVVYKLTLQTKSLYCIHCGKKFEEPSDVFCTQCGSKRI